MSTRRGTPRSARVIAVFGVVVLMTGTLLVTAPAAQAAPCAASTNRSLSGTLKGQDGKFLNAIISVVLTTSDTTRRLGMDGCVLVGGSGYATQVHLNPTLDEGGAATGDSEWHIDHLPANASQFTFEVYPWQASPSSVTWSPYGGVSKRRISIGSAGVSNLNLRLPLVCGQPGGTTGEIRVTNYVNGSPAGHITNPLALSEDTSRGGVQGFRSIENDPPPPVTTVTLDALAPNQRYSGNLQSSGHLISFSSIGVRPCQTTPVYVWSGTHRPAPPRWSPLAASAGGNYFPVPGDFSGDGKDDILWYSPTGADHLWFATGSNTFTDHAVTVGNGFRPVAGDWNGDGIDDLLLYGPGSAPDQVWTFTRGGDHTAVATTARGGSTTWPVAGDFDGNGYDDILFYTPGSTSVIWRHNADGHTTTAVSTGSGYSVRAGDIDGNHLDDLFWHNPSTGAVRLWFGHTDGTFGVRDELTGVAPYQPIFGDFSGDLRADVIFYAPGTGADHFWRGRANASPYFAKEAADLRIDGHFQPVVGDWNGDGTADIFWYGAGGATDAIWRSNQIAWNVYP